MPADAREPWQFCKVSGLLARLDVVSVGVGRQHRQDLGR